MPWIVFTFFIAVFSSALAQENLPGIVKKIEPSAVVILTYDKEGKLIGQGSGFFISGNGDIITNRHVLAGAQRAEVKTTNGKVYTITLIVAEDEEADIIRASVNIPVESVRPLSVSSSIPEVGERIAVIGSPLGLERTVSDGIVSAVREIPAFGKIIQITAPISPGSSGSPVVNMKGEVIGVATLQMVEGQNLNFAVPGNRIARLKTEKGKTLNKWEKGVAQGWLASAEGLNSTGLISLWAGDYEKALPYFEKAVIRNPRYTEAYFYIGYCNDELGRYAEAVEAYKQAIRIKPDCAEAHYNLGLAYGKLGRYTEAVEAYKQAIRIKPDYAEAHYNLGVAYHNLGRYAEAVEAFKQAIRIKPDLADAHYNLGVTYAELGRYAEAVEAFKQAIRIKPDYADAHCNLGVTYGELGHYTEAVEAFKQAIRIKPDYADAHYNLGVTYLRQKRGRFYLISIINIEKIEPSPLAI
jgi:tetratricopeptide (TPR) repeat protein